MPKNEKRDDAPDGTKRGISVPAVINQEPLKDIIFGKATFAIVEIINRQIRLLQLLDFFGEKRIAVAESHHRHHYKRCQHFSFFLTLIFGETEITAG